MARKRDLNARVGNTCACGCGGTTSTRAAIYLPGHDARHVSQVVRKVRLGDIPREEVNKVLPTQPLQEKAAYMLRERRRNPRPVTQDPNLLVVV